MLEVDGFSRADLGVPGYKPTVWLYFCPALDPILPMLWDSCIICFQHVHGCSCLLYHLVPHVSNSVLVRCEGDYRLLVLI
jgi:hypothetical protein